MIVKINNIDYTKKLVSGLSLTQTKTEELDSGVLSLSFLEKTTFKPYSTIDLDIEGIKYRYYVDSYLPTIICKKPLLYKYDIKFFNGAKLLEKVILPNLKYTIPRGKTAKTVYTYLKNIFDKYIKPKKFGLTFALVESELNVDMPEKSWSHPNAKELFNDILSSVPNKPSLVSVDANGNIKSLKLYEYGNDLNKENIANELEYMMSNDYVNSLISDCSDVVGNEKNSRTFPMVSARNIDQAYITNDSATSWQILGSKIEKVNKCIIKVHSKGSMFFEESGQIDDYERDFDVDLADYIIEKTLYDTKKVGFTGGISDTNYNLFKQHYLYFTRGGDSIQGLNYQESWWVVNAPTALAQVINRCFEYQYGKSSGKPIYYVPSKTNYSKTTELGVYIEYQNVGDFRIKTYRDKRLEKDYELVDNQNESYISMEDFTNAEREKINRLGNVIKTRQMTFKSLSEVPNLGDYYGNFILAKRELSFQSNLVLAVLTFSENFIQRNLYYGINTRTRYAQLLNGSESVIREDIKEYNINISTQKDATALHNFSNYFAGYFANGISSLGALTITTYDIFPIKLRTAYLIPTTYGGDRVVNLIARPYDNVNVGMKVTKSSGKLLQDYVSYTNTYGELNYYSIGFYKKLYATIFDNYSAEDLYSYPEYDANIDISSCLITDESITFFPKDNGEILQINRQFNFITDDNKIIIYPKIGIYNTLNKSAKIKAYISQKEYTQYTTQVEGEEIQLSVSDNKILLLTTETDYRSIVITADDQPILAVNNNKIHTLYLNVKGE